MERYFYVFCSVHKGLNTRWETKEEAEKEAYQHAHKPGHSGQVMVKESYKKTRANGTSYRAYKLHHLTD